MALAEGGFNTASTICWATCWGEGFFFESLNWAKEPSSGTCLRIFVPGVGLDPDFRRWSVLPFFSATGKER